MENLCDLLNLTISSVFDVCRNSDYFLGHDVVIKLDEATLSQIEELMTEGDLLEVTLNESVYLWRLLNSIKNFGSELEIVRKMYNIPVSWNF